MKNKANLKTRRSFLSFKNSASDQSNIREENKSEEKVKMLTPDGQLVEVDRSVIESSKNKKVASKEDIHFWTNNKRPS